MLVQPLGALGSKAEDICLALRRSLSVQITIRLNTTL